MRYRERLDDQPNGLSISLAVKIDTGGERSQQRCVERLGTIAVRDESYPGSGRLAFAPRTFVSVGGVLWQDQRRIKFVGEVAVCAPGD